MHLHYPGQATAIAKADFGSRKVGATCIDMRLLLGHCLSLAELASLDAAKNSGIVDGHHLSQSQCDVIGRPKEEWVVLRLSTCLQVMRRLEAQQCTEDAIMLQSALDKTRMLNRQLDQQEMSMRETRTRVQAM